MGFCTPNRVPAAGQHSCPPMQAYLDTTCPAFPQPACQLQPARSLGRMVSARLHTSPTTTSTCACLKLHHAGRCGSLQTSPHTRLASSSADLDLQLQLPSWAYLQRGAKPTSILSHAPATVLGRRCHMCLLWLLFDWLGPDSSSRFRACCICW